MKSTFGRAAAVKTIDAATATAARDSRHILLKGASHWEVEIFKIGFRVTSGIFFVREAL
jgi:hypothetical protein